MIRSDTNLEVDDTNLNRFLRPSIQVHLVQGRRILKFFTQREKTKKNPYHIIIFRTLYVTQNTTTNRVVFCKIGNIPGRLTIDTVWVIIETYMAAIYLGI